MKPMNKMATVEFGGESTQERRGVANRLEESDVQTASRPFCAPSFRVTMWTLGWRWVRV